VRRDQRGFGDVIAGDAGGRHYLLRAARVVATGELGSACGSVAVTMAQPVSISQQPGNIMACTPGGADFSVTAAGTNPGYRWQRLDAGTWVNLSDGADPVLGTISGATAPTVHVSYSHGTGGSMRCMVSNACGGMSSNSATLSVSPADVGQQGGVPGTDGLYDNNDFVVFIGLFFAQDAPPTWAGRRAARGGRPL